MRAKKNNRVCNEVSHTTVSIIPTDPDSIDFLNDFVEEP